MLRAVTWARTVVPEYARGFPVSDADTDRLAGAANLRVHTIEGLSVPALLTFPFGDRGLVHFRLALQPGIRGSARRYIILHETQHIRAGDVEEEGPVIMHHIDPLPARASRPATSLPSVECSTRCTWAKVRNG